MAITNADKAYEFILEKIIKAELAPGSVIEEPALMDEFKLGRTPIREALQRLQVAKFVIVSPRRGIFVAPITLTDINRIYEIRLELEAFNIRLAAKRITPQQIQTLEKQLEDCKDFDMMVTEECIELDRQFHFLVYETSRNPLLTDDLKRYYYMSQRIWYHGYQSLKTIVIGLQDHPVITAYLKAGDALKAEEMVRKHISNFQNHIKESLF